MHARFNQFYPGIYLIPFRKYIVWSNYFKQKLYCYNPKYRNSEIIYKKPRYQSLPQVKTGDKIENAVNILWLGESLMLLDEIIPYILQIDRKKFNIFYRPKASPSKQLRKFFDLHRITVVSDPSFYESLINNSYEFVLALIVHACMNHSN